MSEAKPDYDVATARAVLTKDKQQREIEAIQALRRDVCERFGVTVTARAYLSEDGRTLARIVVTAQ